MLDRQCNVRVLIHSLMHFLLSSEGELGYVFVASCVLDLCMWKATHWEQHQICLDTKLHLVFLSALPLFTLANIASSISSSSPHTFLSVTDDSICMPLGFFSSLSHSVFMLTIPIGSFWVNLPSAPFTIASSISLSRFSHSSSYFHSSLLFSLHCYTTASLPLGLSLSPKQP